MIAEAMPQPKVVREVYQVWRCDVDYDEVVASYEYKLEAYEHALNLMKAEDSAEYEVRGLYIIQRSKT